MKMRNILAVLVAACMLILAVGCSTPAKTAEGTATAAGAAVDRDKLAAKVGDYEITVGDLQDMYDSILEMYSYYGQSAPTADADIETAQDSALQQLIDGKVLLYQAAKQGFDVLSEEQEAELRQTVDDSVAELITYYSEDAETEGSEEDVRNAAIASINEELTKNGWNMDFEGYCTYLEDYYRENYVKVNLENSVKNGVTVTDEEVKAEYDKLYEQQKTDLEDPTKYLASEESYEMEGGEPMLIVPAGYIRVKVLNVMPTGTLDESYESLVTEVADLEAEYGKLQLGGNTDATRLAEIKTLYEAKKLESDKLFNEYSAEAKAKIEQAKAELDAGTVFDVVFANYNEDTTYTTYETFMNKGRLMMPGQDDGAWDAQVREAAKGLSAGQYSDIVKTDDGFSIVYYVADEPAGDVAYETVQEAVKAIALETKQNTAWEAQQETWAADTSYITKYESNYRSIGK